MGTNSRIGQFIATVVGIAAFYAVIFVVDVIQINILAWISDVEVSWDVLGWFGMGGAEKPMIPWWLHIWPLIMAPAVSSVAMTGLSRALWCGDRAPHSIASLVIEIISVVCLITNIVQVVQGNAGFSSIVISFFFLAAGWRLFSFAFAE